MRTGSWRLFVHEADTLMPRRLRRELGTQYHEQFAALEPALRLQSRNHQRAAYPGALVARPHRLLGDLVNAIAFALQRDRTDRAVVAIDSEQDLAAMFED